MANNNTISAIPIRQSIKPTYAERVAAHKAKRLRRATSPQHKAAVARNRDLAGIRLDNLEAKASAGDLVAAHLIGGVK